MTICTWNCQGDPTKYENKMAVLQSLIRKYDVVLLQECGGMANAHALPCKCYHEYHAGAFNQRCCMAILTHKDVSSYNSRYKTDIGRPIQVIQIGCTVIYNFHANASTGSGAITVLSAMVKQLDDMLTLNVVAAGDWNRAPSEQMRLFRESKLTSPWYRSNTFRYKGGRKTINFELVTPCFATHQSGLLLDYFIFSGISSPLRPQLAYETDPKDIKNFCSDHLPIALTLT